MRCKKRKEKVTYFVCEEHGVVQAVQPLPLVEEPLVLSGDAIVHVLHGEADAVGKVLE